jgi:hypothetical protein
MRRGIDPAHAAASQGTVLRAARRDCAILCARHGDDTEQDGRKACPEGERGSIAHGISSLDADRPERQPASLPECVMTRQWRGGASQKAGRQGPGPIPVRVPRDFRI